MSPHYCNRCGGKLDDRLNCATCNSYEPVEVQSETDKKLDKLISQTDTILYFAVFVWVVMILAILMLFLGVV